MAGEKTEPGAGESPSQAAAPAPGSTGDGAASAFVDLDAQPKATAEDSTAEQRAIDAAKMDLVLDIPIRLSVELGRTDIPIRDVMHLGRGSMVELDRGPGAPLDVRVNGVLIGRGEVVVVNEEKLGLRFVDVVSQAERIRRLR